jgi:hypothetical protein
MRTGIDDGMINIGRLVVWNRNLDHLPASAAADAAREIERLGFGTIWFPEATRREAIANASLLLHATERIVVASGIATSTPATPSPPPPRNRPGWRPSRTFSCSAWVSVICRV